MPARPRGSGDPGLDPWIPAFAGMSREAKQAPRIRSSLMSLELYLIFVAATAILIATPGPNVALIVGTSLTHGARTGLVAMAGVNLGVMVQLVVVAAGLSWIVEVFAKNFDVIRFVGAAYLLFLGIQTLWKARKPAAPQPLSPERAFGRGLAVAFANPKTLIFQAAFLPQFLTNGEGRAT